jgi:hypothetical protein
MAAFVGSKCPKKSGLVRFLTNFSPLRSGVELGKKCVHLL